MAVWGRLVWGRLDVSTFLGAKHKEGAPCCGLTAVQKEVKMVRQSRQRDPRELLLSRVLLHHSVQLCGSGFRV